MDTPERREIATAIVGVILTYPTAAMPPEVTVDWELYPDPNDRVPATATDPAGPLPSFLTPDDSIHTWTNYLRNYRLPTVQQVAVAGSLGEFSLPAASIVLALLMLPAGIWFMRCRQRAAPTLLPVAALTALVIAAIAAYPVARVTVARPMALAGELPPEQARDLLQVLLKNVYRAFDFREEEDVYDKLAISVDGELLSDIYLQNRRSFAVQQAGGAQAKIKSVDILDAVAERLDDQPAGYAIRGQWSAQGTVGHWGHTHTRRNRYEAIVTVRADEGAWKITDLETLEEQRVDPVYTATGDTASAPPAELQPGSP